MGDYRNPAEKPYTTTRPPETSAPHSAPVVTDSLPAGIPQAPTRRGSPKTSFLAAASVRNITETQKAILCILRKHGPLTDEQIVARYRMLSCCCEIPHYPQAADSGIRSRRKQLCDAGLVEDSGHTAAISTGRQATVWRLK